MQMNNEHVMERYGQKELIIFRNRYKPQEREENKRYDTETDKEKGMSQTKSILKITRFELGNMEQQKQQNDNILEIRLTEMAGYVKWTMKCIENQKKAQRALINNMHLMATSYESYFEATTPIIKEKIKKILEETKERGEEENTNNLMHAYENEEEKKIKDYFREETVNMEKEKIKDIQRAVETSETIAKTQFKNIEKAIGNIKSAFEDMSELERQYTEQMKRSRAKENKKKALREITQYMDELMVQHEKRRKQMVKQNIETIQIQHELYKVRPDIYKSVLKRIEHFSKTIATANHFDKLFEYGAAEVYRRTKAMQQIDYTLNELRAKYVEAIYAEHKQRNEFRETLKRLPYQISAETLEATIPGLSIKIPEETFKTYAGAYPDINPNKLDIEKIKSLFPTKDMKKYIEDIYVKQTIEMLNRNYDNQMDPEELQVVMEQTICKKEDIKEQHDKIMLKQELEEAQRQSRELQAQLTNADAEFLVTIDSIQQEAKTKEDELQKKQKQLNDDAMNAIALSLQFAQKCLNRNAFKQDQLKSMIDRYHSLMTNEGIAALSQALTKDMYANNGTL